MHDELIKADEIYIQDIVQKAVLEDPKRDIVDIYNIVCSKLDIGDMNKVVTILKLIKLNKQLFLC